MATIKRNYGTAWRLALAVLVVAGLFALPDPAPATGVSDTLSIAKDADIVFTPSGGAGEDSTYNGNTVTMYIGAYGADRTQYAGLVQVDKSKLRTSRPVNGARLQFVNSSLSGELSSLNFIGAWLVDKDFTEGEVTTTRRTVSGGDTTWWNDEALGATLNNWIQDRNGAASFYTIQGFTDTMAVLPDSVDRPLLPVGLWASRSDTLHASEKINLDVTPEVAKFVSGDRTGYLGFLIAFYDTSEVTSFYSWGSRTAGSASNRPRLIIDYGDSIVTTTDTTITYQGMRVGYPFQWGVTPGGD